MNAGWFKRGQIAWNKGIKNSTGVSPSRFKKGHTPARTRDVAEERIDSEGYTYIKVSKDEKYKSRFWRLKHRLIYEQFHGEIPKGSIVCFFDNDKQNMAINNLFAVTRGEHAILNKLKFSSEPIELKPSILMLARLKMRVNEIAQKKDRRYSYTPEQNAFLKEHPLLDRAVLAEKFNARFGTDKAIEAIRNHCRRLGMRMPPSGQFEKGNVPPNAGKKGFCQPGSEKGWFKKGNAMNKYEVGTEFVKEGILFIKYTDEHKEARKNFAPKHRVIWRKYHGEIGKDDVITFKDGNRMNCNIENLEKIDRGLFMTLSKVNYVNEPMELKPVIKSLTELQIKTRKIQTQRGIK